MAVNWCASCKARGRLSIASREVAGTLMCDECFGGKPSKGIAAALFVRTPAVKEKENAVPKPIDDATKEAIRQDVASGMSVNEAATKNSVGWMTAKKCLDGNGGKKSAGGGVPKARPRLAVGEPERMAA